VAGTLTTETTPQLDDDELFVDLSLEGGSSVFHALPELLLPAAHSEEFYLRRLHTLITDFLTLMPLRIKAVCCGYRIPLCLYIVPARVADPDSRL
jgi:hypothetical protein